METKTALIRSDRRIKLYAVTSVYLYISFVIFPYHFKLDQSFRFDDTFDHSIFFIFRILFYQRLQRFENLKDRLQIFGLIWITFCKSVINTFKICISECHIVVSFSC